MNNLPVVVQITHLKHTLLLLTIYIYIKSFSTRKQQVLVEAGGDNRRDNPIYGWAR